MESLVARGAAADAAVAVGTAAANGAANADAASSSYSVCAAVTKTKEGQEGTGVNVCVLGMTAPKKQEERLSIILP